MQYFFFHVDFVPFLAVVHVDDVVLLLRTSASCFSRQLINRHAGSKQVFFKKKEEKKKKNKMKTKQMKRQQNGSRMEIRYGGLMATAIGPMGQQ